MAVRMCEGGGEANTEPATAAVSIPSPTKPVQQLVKILTRCLKGEKNYQLLNVILETIR